MDTRHASPEGPAGAGAREPLVRFLTREDLPALVQVWTASGLTIRPAGRERPDRLAAEWAQYPRNFIGAFAGEAMIGACIASWDGRRGFVNRLGVLPAWRRTGVASKLVQAAESELRARGAQIIAALVEPNNSASLSLFDRLGYRDVPRAVYLSKRDAPDV